MRGAARSRGWTESADKTVTIRTPATVRSASRAGSPGSEGRSPPQSLGSPLGAVGGGARPPPSEASQQYDSSTGAATMMALADSGAAVAPDGTPAVGSTVLVPAEGLPCVGDSLGGLLVKGVLLDNDLVDGFVKVKLYSSRLGGWASGGEWRGNITDCRPAATLQQLEQFNGDLADLPVKDEDSVVDALRYRWVRGRTCSQIRGSLICINPIGSGAEADTSLGPAAVAATGGSKETKDLTIDSFCSRVITQRALTGRGAAVLFNGESGAGKSFAARHLFARARGAIDTKASRAGRASATVLEAFGNARTLANDDASRFGCFRQIWPATRTESDRLRRKDAAAAAGAVEGEAQDDEDEDDDDFFEERIAGGACSSTHFLLERSRVSSFHDSERSFHIFYQMLAGLPREDKRSLQLAPLQEYRCLASGVRRIRGIDDGKRLLGETLPALTTLGLSKAVQKDLFRALGGILACSNLVWEQTDDGLGFCSTDSWFERVSSGFGVKSSELRSALGVGNVSAQAIQQRTVELAGGVYAGIFSWLVQVSNRAACEVMPTEPWIGIVDIFGSEKLLQNHFEQLLANHTGEWLHSLFVKHALKPLQDAEWSKGYKAIELASSCRALLELVEGPPPGSSFSASILGLVDRRFAAGAVGPASPGSPGSPWSPGFPGSPGSPGIGGGGTSPAAAASTFARSEEQLAKDIHETFKNSAMYSIGHDKRCFRIHHTFRAVEYSVSGFYQRNLSRLEAGRGASVVLSKSGNGVIREAFKASGGRGGAGARQRRRDEGSVGSTLCKQLRDLEQQLTVSGTDLHFVHCLRSNWGFLVGKEVDEKFGTFQWDCVAQSCMGLGIFDACRLHWATAERFASKAGLGNFVYRRRHAEFLADYGSLVLPMYWTQVKTDPVSVMRLILDVTPENSYFIGRELVGVQPQCAKVLDEHRRGVSSRLSALARQVQNALRAKMDMDTMSAQREYNHRFLSKLQAMTRRRFELSPAIARDRAKKQVLGVARLMHAVVAMRPYMIAAMSIQRYVRGVQARRWFRNQKLIAQAERQLIGAVRAAKMRRLVMQEVQHAAATKIQRRWKYRSNTKWLVDTNTVSNANRMLVSAFQVLRSRCNLVVHLSDGAATQLQVLQRKMADRKQAQEKDEAERSKALIIGAVRAARLRAELEEVSADVAVRKVQAAWHRKKDRLRKVKEQEWKGTLEVFTAFATTLQMRAQLSLRRSQDAGRILYKLKNRILTRRRIRSACVTRLQDRLSSMYHRLLAQRLLFRLREESVQRERGTTVLNVLKALAARLSVVQHIDAKRHAAALALQNAHRGATARREIRLMRMGDAKLDIEASWRRFEAWNLMQGLSEQGGLVQAGEHSHSVFQTLRLRLRLSETVRRLDAASLIQRVGKGWLVRSGVRRRRCDVSWQQMCTLLGSVWAKYSAQQELVRLQFEHAHRHAIQLWCSAVFTMQWRFVHAAQVDAMRRKQASATLESMVRMAQVKRSQHYLGISFARSRVRLELEDERIQIRHYAALVIQRSWRRFITMFREILPRLVYRLAIERRSLQKSCERESRTLANLGSGRMRAVYAHSLRTAHHSTNVFKPTQNEAEAPGWLNTIGRIGEDMVDLDFGANFALGVGSTGSAYLCNISGAVSRLTFRGPRLGQGVKFLAQQPKVVNVACGDGHALLLTDKGFLYGWGSNEHGQCGIGDWASGDPIIGSVRYPTCIQSWALSGETEDPPSEDRTGRGGLPCVKFVTCGPQTSAAISPLGALWLWGSRKQLGLARLRPSVPMPDCAPFPPFLLFGHTKELQNGTASGGASVNGGSDFGAGKAWARSARSEIGLFESSKPAPIPVVSSSTPTSRAFAPMGRAAALAAANAVASGDWDTGSVTTLAPSEDRPPSPSGASAASSPSKSKSRSSLTMAQLVGAVLESAELEVIGGDVVSPAICGVVISPLSGVERGRGAGFVRLPASGGDGAGFVTARIHNAPFASVKLGDGGVNFAVSERGQMQSWGPGGNVTLGRAAPLSARAGETLAPARLPVLVNFALPIQQVAIGAGHVAVLTGHGRLFTWGELEACMGTEGFRRHCISEPFFVEGALRDVRIAHVAAGRGETAVAAYQADVVLGWDLLEISAAGNKLLPAVYHYTRARGSFASRLAMRRSEALQILIMDMEDPQPVHPSLLGGFCCGKKGVSFGTFGGGNSALLRSSLASPLSPSSKGPAKCPDQAFMDTTAASTAASVNSSLFRWAATHKESRMPLVNTRTKPLPLAACTVNAIMNPKELAEVDRKLAGFRRLAVERGKTAHVWRARGARGGGEGESGGGGSSGSGSDGEFY